jgi:hypothetical protein
VVEPLAPEVFGSPSPWLPAFSVVDADWIAVARDAIGGVFVVCEREGGRQCCLHVDTQGHAVVVGKTLADGGDARHPLALLARAVDPTRREISPRCSVWLRNKNKRSRSIFPPFPRHVPTS